MTLRCGLFGGTFNPVHAGHVVLATEVVEALGLDRLVVVPARRSPHKADEPSAPGPIRLALLRAAFAGRADVVVVDWELLREGPSYTIDTLADGRRAYPDAVWTLVLGADSVADFPRWRAASEIAAAADLAIAVRPGAPDDVLGPLRAALPGIRARVVPTTPIGVSSTLVRARAARGLPLRGYVPDAVAKALEESGLYRAASSATTEAP